MPKRDAYIEVRLKIEAVFKNYSAQSERYKRSKLLIKRGHSMPSQ
jgi:hypothetical protein